MKYKNFLIELAKVSRIELLTYPKNIPKSKLSTVKIILRYMAGRSNPKARGYSWPNAFLAQSLEYSHSTYGDAENLSILREYYDSWKNKGSIISSIDYVMNGYSLIYLYEQTEDNSYLTMIERIEDYILNYPVDSNGSFPYRPKNSNDIFIDALGMVCPFLARLAENKNDSQLMELAVKQLQNFYDHGFSNSIFLPYHSYNSDSDTLKGIIGWGRSVGWIAIGTVDTLQYMDKSHSGYNKLVDKFKKMINTSIMYLGNNGAFHWQLEATQGLVDSSATAMIGYSIAKAISIGILDNSYIEYVEKNIRFLQRVTKDGYVYESSAECRGLAMHPQILEWNPWSQGPTLMLMSVCEHLF